MQTIRKQMNYGTIKYQGHTSSISVISFVQGSSLMMEAVRTSETSIDNHFTRQYIPEGSSEHHTRRRENLKSHNH
jgi:hypothetical protein